MMKQLSCKSLGASPAHHHRASRWVSVLVLAAATAGCIDSTVVMCADGLACPATLRCDDVHHTCVLPEQLTVCHDLGDGANCTSGPISGGCFDSVCLPRGCGNRVVEPGEMCDDGNQIAGDGCSGDCRSTEHCGNGFVDPGEPCDDGNLASHDGCDSRCNLEQAVWSDAIAIAPGSLDAQYTAYDAARGTLVYAGLGGTWEWDGTRWTFTPYAGEPNFVLEGVFYDSDRGQVCAIGTNGSGFARRYAWTDGHWVLDDTTDGPVLGAFPPQVAVVHDAARGRMMMIENATGAAWSIDATGAWVDAPGLPGAPGESVAVFDPASSEIVLETTDSVEWVFDGTDWTSSPTSFGARVSLAFDPDRGRVVLVDNVDRTTHERVGAAWHAIDNADAPCVNAFLFTSMPMYHDRRSPGLTLFSSTADEICRWDQAWTADEPPLPFRPIAASYDPIRHAFIVLNNIRPEDPDSPTRTWLLGDSGWQRIDTPDAPYGRGNPLAVYSPGRAATVLYGEQVAPPPGGVPVIVPCGDPTDYNTDTWSFDGTNWTSLTSFTRSGAPCSRNGATYDATHGRIVLATHDELWSLGDTDAAWQRVATPASVGHVFNLAWDARNNSLMAARLDAIDSSPLFDLRGDDWTPIEIIPSGLNSTSNALIPDLRAGTVIVVETNFGRAWERAGNSWLRLPDAPIVGLFASWTAYDPRTGKVLYVGRRDSGVFAAILSRTSATPFESCNPGEDLDGDGLAGCSDPDCAWTCR